MLRKHFKRSKSKSKEKLNVSNAFPSRPALAAVPASLHPHRSHPGAAIPIPHTQPGAIRSEDDPFSDPDSSLYDYEHANEPGYATVDFGTLERHQRLADQQRSPHPLPSDSNGNNNARNMYHVLEPTTSSQREMDELYAIPHRKHTNNMSMQRSSPRRSHRSSTRPDSDRTDTGIGGSLRDTTGEVRRAMRELHTLPVEVHEPMMVNTRVLKSSATPRRGGHTRNSDMVGDTQVIAQLEQQVVDLQQRNDHLSSQNEALTKVASALDEGDMESAQATLLRKQIQDIKDERETLKNAVHRLNIELSKYQAKYRPVTYGKDSHDIVGLPSKGPIPSWLINTKYLAPLFMAYDDQITAKEALIQQYKSQLESLKVQAQNVIQENDRLRISRETSLDELGISGPTTPAEWQQIQEQARLVLEENQVVMEQLEVQHNKSADLAAAHSQQVARLSRQLVTSEASRSDLERDIEQLKVKYKDMKVLVDQTLIDSPIHISTQEHTTTVKQLKQTIIEQHDKHDKQLIDVNTKLEAMTLERNDLVIKVTDLTGEIKELEAKLCTVDKAFTKYEERIYELYQTIEDIQNDEITSQKQLGNIIKVAENTAFERDTYAKVARDQEGETKKALNKLLAGNVTVGKLQEKLKQYKQKAAAKLTTIAEQMKEMDSSFDYQRDEFNREIRHLQLLLQEKAILLQSAEADKHQVEADLEVMWQAASCENERMKESIRHSYTRINRAATATDACDEYDEDIGDGTDDE